MILLDAQDLFRFYHVGDAEIRALKGVSLNVSAGEIIALTGPSGSGKSTLLSCLCGLDEPDGGTVDIGGRRMTRRPETEKAAIRVSTLGILAQRDNLFPHLTVAENIAFALCRRSGGDPVDIEQMLQSVALSERANAYPATLSGGEIARAGLAVALALEAPLIVADEPTAEVDEATERMILAILADRSRRGKGALIATHSRAVAAIATRTLHLRDGRLVERPLVETLDEAEHLFEDATRPMLRNDRETLIEARGLGRNYDLGDLTVHAVENADIVMRQGDRIAVTGPSGSGKSTLLKMLAGIVRPSSGLLAWFGAGTATGLRPGRIGVVFQEPSLIPSLTVRENVALPLQLAARSSQGRAHMSADDALALLSLADLSDKLPDEISGGQMQRVAFARALVTNPEIILADEPTGQLDQPTGRAVMEAVLDALGENETALLLTTHDERLARTMATQLRMDHGRLAEVA
ncbi:ABC transporter ATP-binding protein [Aurantimonas marina]|uniref:ABC transporter ATP-binding protein n=1 Tax=Aurantimonas marina TaxID=2780508 RepID=UPI0019D23866